MRCGNELLFLAGIKHADRNFSAMEFAFIFHLTLAATKCTNAKAEIVCSQL